MGRAGRIARGIMVLVSVLLLASCGDSFNDAYCEANNHRNQQTVEHLTNVLEQKRNQPGLYLARARCHYFLGAYAQALQDASEVIRRLPNKADAYLLRAKAGKMLGQIPQALQDYSAAIKFQPTAEAHYGRGLTYVREYQGKDREALEDFTAAIPRSNLQPPRTVSARTCGFGAGAQARSHHPQCLLQCRLCALCAGA